MPNDGFGPVRAGGGISLRRVFLGAVILVLITASTTYLAVSYRYQGLITGLGGESRQVMEELSRSPAFGRFLTVISLVNSQYVERPELETLMQGAAEGVVGALGDPYSSFFTEPEFKDFHFQTEGTYGGIGIQVTDEGKYVVVVSAFPGTPGAETAFEGAVEGDPRGLKPKDRIITVDGQDLVGVSVDKAVDLIRGEPGDPVTLVVQRLQDGASYRQLTFKITRAVIRVPTTRAEMIAPGIGYLHITQFLPGTANQVRRDLQSLKGQGLRSLIVDLRHNPGGLLDTVVEVANHFIPAGPVVHVVNRLGERETLRSENPNGLGVPLVVLVDEATASASEILAGAVQDREAGTVVGARTFGKGLVQQVWSLDNGTGLKLTISKYLTPSGRDINRRVVDDETGEVEGGLEPDIVVERTEEMEFGVMGKDPQLDRALEVVREALRARR